MIREFIRMPEAERNELKKLVKVLEAELRKQVTK